MKWVVTVGGALLIIGIGAVYYFDSDPVVSSFAECEAAGYPVGESYPRQCWTPDGKHFVEDVEPVGEFWGTAVGTVMLGPTCPVERDPPDPECADKPYQTQLVVTSADGSKIIKESGSDASGKFYIELPPGEYALRSAAAGNILPYCQSPTFTIHANGSTEVTVSCDTGIR